MRWNRIRNGRGSYVNGKVERGAVEDRKRNLERRRHRRGEMEKESKRKNRR